jgi:toxin HigB-1
VDVEEACSIGQPFIILRSSSAPTRRFGADVQKLAPRKLRMLDAAARLDDLRVPPGNRLERLRGDRSGQDSIRINDQWPICFRWQGGDAHDVEIVDYH